LKMPDEKLSADEIQTLKDWVQRGAFDDRQVRPEATDPMDWWSLRTLIAPPIPGLPSGGSPDSQAHPIDAFIEAKLQASGLVRSAMASPEERIRRVYFDLVGIPPTLDQTRAFLQSPTESAYRWSISSWIPLTMASDGLGTGSIQCTSRTPTVTSTMSGATMLGPIAIM
jgi:hypothetical protein